MLGAVKSGQQAKAVVLQPTARTPLQPNRTALLCPSSGPRDYGVDYHIGRFVLGLL